MFKKLKEKITEEVKSSPQRLQQLTQPMMDRLQNSATSDENFFSIGDDDASTPNTSLEAGFSNVSLTSPQEVRARRTSNSSIASDVSFLPRYESISNMYHLQSDLDVSASEIEDNASSSSQLGHLSKEQIYSAFQKSQMRYHKYRGRYTDLARHYKDLEREIAKMKSVLVETQDKAIRRVTELKEQCALEQKAKAHLESALRDEIDEKQFKIQSLETKIGLLQAQPEENLESLTKYLTDARQEIESLNEKIQELKANAIVFQSKEQDYKSKLSAYAEREKESNLNLAQSKMELHNEILSKDAELSSLKQDNEVLRQSLEAFETKSANGRLENLQSQNKKLIERVESLSLKCQQYESDLLKTEQFKIQARESDEKLESFREEAKQSLLSLEAKIREQVEAEFQKKVAELPADSGDFQKRESDEKIARVEEELRLKTEKYSQLETNHLELIEDTVALRNQIAKFEREVAALQNENSGLERRIVRCQEERLTLERNYDALNGEKLKLAKEYSSLKMNFDALQEELRETGDRNLELGSLNVCLEEKIRLLEEKLEAVELDKNESGLLEMKLQKLETEKKSLLESFENERRVFDADSLKLKESDEALKKLHEVNAKLEQDILHLKSSLQALESELSFANEEKLKVERLNRDLEEKVRIFEEKDEAIDLDRTESGLLEMKLQKLEAEKKLLDEQFEAECKNFEKKIDEYHTKLEVSEKVGDKLREEVKQAEDALKIKQSQIESLENCLKAKDLEIAEISETSNNNLNKVSKELENFTSVEKDLISKIDYFERELEIKNTEIEEHKILIKEKHELVLRVQELESDLLAKNSQIETLLRIFDECNSSIEERRESFLQIISGNNKINHRNDEKTVESFDAKLKRFQDNFLREKVDFSKLLICFKQLEEKYSTLLAEKEQLKSQIQNLRLFESNCEILEREKAGLLLEIEDLRSRLCDVSSQKNSLENSAREFEHNLPRLREENGSLKDALQKLENSLAETAERSRQISSDNAFLTEENQSLIAEIEGLKLKTQQAIDLESELDACKVKIDGLSREKQQLQELERHFNELINEKQLLQDEIQELKISPLNVGVSQKAEVEELREKLQQYKSLDLTNKTSIEFYECELEKLKNQNDKLARRLDETLVTLSHCAELSSSTEIEYLRNVLYNYMLGKESLVLARVIAAVCKFDAQQTETVLAKEQQKQTLLGQLGIL